MSADSADEVRTREEPRLRPLDDVFGHLVRRAQQLHVAVWSETVAHGLTSPQFAVLHTAARHRAVDQATLADLVSLDRSTTGQVVARLERRGLLRRQRAADDSRRYEVALTERGADVLREVEAQADAVNERLLQPLAPEDRKRLMQLLRTVLERAE